MLPNTYTKQELIQAITIDTDIVYRIPKVYLKDKDIASLDEITLSYTFFPSKNPKSPVAELTEPPKPQL